MQYLKLYKIFGTLFSFETITSVLNKKICTAICMLLILGSFSFLQSQDLSESEIDDVYSMSNDEMHSLINQSGLSGKRISQENIKQLKLGKPVFFFIDDIKDSSFVPKTEIGTEILKNYQDINPNFIIESFFVLPVPEGMEKATLEEVNRFLTDIKQFVGIPYWSKEFQKYFDLFEYMEIIERGNRKDGSRMIRAEQNMKPFDNYEVEYRYIMEKDNFVYTSINTTPIHYKFVKAVKEGNMYTSLFVHAQPGALVFYGLGGVRAFTFFGIFGDRMEVSFIGRTEAFFRWFHKEFVLTRMQEKLREE